MITNLRKAAALLLCFVLVGIHSAPAAAASAETVLPSGISAGELSREIEAFVSDHSDTTAGMAVSVFNREDALYRGYFGFADAEAGREVDAQTVMEWGSITKLLVWVSVMQLWEQRKLQLEEDVRSYLPEGFLRNIRFEEPVTMLHLMNHNAGFEESIAGIVSADRNRVLPLETYLREVQPYQAYPPGSVTAYSNWSVALAGYIVEQVSGEPFHKYAKEHIFTPLGMEHSALLPTLEDNPWVQTRREFLANYSYEGQLLTDGRSYFSIYPAGMCTSTLEDMERFGNALLNRESPLFANASTYDRMLSPSAYYGDSDIGLNFHGLWAQSYYSTEVIGHGGNTFGCSAILLLDPANGIGMAVMTNQNGESVYTMEMPHLIYGTGSYPSPDYTGYMYRARTIGHGPMKFYKLFSLYHISREDGQSGLLILTQDGASGKITAPAGNGDFLLTDLPRCIAFALPLLLWCAALVFCLAGLIGQGISALVRRYRQQRRKRPLTHWQWISCLLQLLPLCWAPGFLSLLGPSQWPLWLYRVMFGSFLLFAAVYGVQILWGIGVMCRKRKASAFQIAVVVSLCISVVNIFYWELGYFWML